MTGSSLDTVNPASLLSAPGFRRLLIALHCLHIVVLTGFASNLGIVDISTDAAPGASPLRPIYVLGRDGRPLPASAGRVSVSTLSEQTLRSGKFIRDGLFSLGPIAIPGTVPGGSGEILLSVWDATTGSTYESATVRARVRIQIFPLGGGSVFPPANWYQSSDFSGVDLRIPEGVPNARIDRVESTTLGAQIHAIASRKYTYSLQASFDLRNWYPAARSATPSGDLDFFQGELAWTIVPVPSPQFWRVIRVPTGAVNLNNNFTPPGASSKAYVTDKYGGPLPKGVGMVEVLDELGNQIWFGGLVVPGIFAAGAIEIPGLEAGGGGTITIRAWDIRSGDTYDTARDRGEVRVTLRNLGGDGRLPPGLGTTSDFAGLTVACWGCPWWLNASRSN